MAGSRTLKLSILADVDDLKRKLNSADNEVQSFGDKLGKWSKVAGAAFAAAGAAAAAYAGKLLVDGVKSAIEDEKAQAKLATTLKNVTGATDAQIKSVEDQILKTSLLTGKTDDELRPSLERLTRATGDVAKAQELQKLALDVSAGSGKDLETVSNALGKAYEGNTTALGKLGLGIDAAQLKSMSFDEITKTLASTFKDQAAIQADTFAGKMDRLKVAFDEGKETVGSFVLDAITPLISGFVNDVVPAIQGVASELGENLQPVFTALSDYFHDVFIPALKAVWGFINDYVIPILNVTLVPIVKALFGAFDQVTKSIKNNQDGFDAFFRIIKPFADFIKNVLAPVFGTVLAGAIKIIGSLIVGLITGFGNVAKAIDKVIDAIKEMIRLITNNPIVKGIGNLFSSVFGGGKATGGPVSAGTSYLVGERGPELFTPSRSGSIIPNGMGGGSIINITVNGAIDAASTARQIANLLNNEATLAGNFQYGIGNSRLITA